LWRCAQPELHQIPATWLVQIIESIQTAEFDTITRRSGGYPHVVLVILAGAPAVHASAPHPCVGDTIQRLTAIAAAANHRRRRESSPAAGGGSEPAGLNPSLEEDVAARVHCFNILRTLVRDTELGPAVAPHVPELVKLAVSGFDASAFPIRNAALMLFSCIVTRLFGVKRVRDEHHTANSIAASELFARHPGLFGIVLARLQLNHSRSGNGSSGGGCVSTHSAGGGRGSSALHDAATLARPDGVNAHVATAASALGNGLSMSRQTRMVDWLNPGVYPVLVLLGRLTVSSAPPVNV
jgi:hypothetical protein